MGRRLLSVLLIVTIISGFVLNGIKVRADGIDYANVTLEQLSKMKDDPDELACVHGVAVTEYSCNKKIEDAIMLMTKCPNIEHIYIYANGLKLDKEFFNNLSSSRYIYMSLGWCEVDFSGVNNKDIDTLYFSLNKVEHYEEIVNLESLKTLSLDGITGFCRAEYSKLKDLECLMLIGQRIDDYQDFCKECSHVEELSLKCCNLRDSDTRYITAYMKDLENINLYGTYVEDITFLKDLPYLSYIGLPTGVDKLDVLYELKDLECVSFDCYTELFVDDKLEQFWKDNNIDYTKYDKDTRGKIDSLVASMNIPDNATDKEKIEKVTECVLLNMKCEMTDVSQYTGTSLDACLYFKAGVCHDYSTLSYTLLKSVGVDAYLIRGYATDYYGTPPGPHAWIEVYADGEWYGIEPMWIDNDNEDPTTAKYKEKFWSPFYMRPTKTDDLNDWPANGDFSKCPEKCFAMHHITMNDPMDTLPEGKNTAAPEYKKYTVKFRNDDGSELTSVQVPFGDAPSYTGTTPVKEETELFTYTFDGWTDGTNTYGAGDELPATLEDAMFTAVFTKAEKPAEAPVTEELHQDTQIPPVVFAIAGTALVLLAGAGAVAVILMRNRKKKVN